MESERTSMTTSVSGVAIRVQALGALARWVLELQQMRSPILRYGFAVVCVAIATGLSLTFQHYQMRDVEFALFTLSIAIITWYAGNGPSALAIFLSAMLFNYFFTEPLYSFAIAPRDLPYFFIF